MAPVSDLATIGKRIQEIRQSQTDLSQEALARSLGVSWVTVSRLERGVGKGVTIDRLHDVAAALGVTVDDLLKEAA